MCYYVIPYIESANIMDKEVRTIDFSSILISLRGFSDVIVGKYTYNIFCITI